MPLIAGIIPAPLVWQWVRQPERLGLAGKQTELSRGNALQRKKIMTTEAVWDASNGECRRNAFNAGDYVIGILQGLASGAEHILIRHPEKGELLVNPKQGKYIARIPDMTAFCQAPKAEFSVTEVQERFPPTLVAQRIEDLLWEATLCASQGRLIDGLRKYDVVQFTRWPNLTRLSLTPNVMRICALLTRFPSGLYLSRIILQIDEAEVNSVCSAAYAAGIVKLLNRKIEIDTAEVALAEVNAQKAVEPKSSQFLGRLFAKLSGL